MTEYVTVKVRTLVRIVYVLGLIGVMLACFGIADAYSKLGDHDDNIITWAILIASALTVGVIAYTRSLRRRR